MIFRKIREILTHLEILSFSTEACERYGKLMNDLQLTGTPIGDLDAMIASIALTHNEPILTSDTKHFEKVPSLVVETWKPLNLEDNVRLQRMYTTSLRR
jgi:tRNA(fMet)-specific endonuclease VapC